MEYGKRLRECMDVDDSTFYDSDRIAIMPMGFCYPGTGKSGDLAPRPECAPAWRPQLLEHLNKLELTIVLGGYAQKYHFGEASKSVTTLVKSWETYWPNNIIPLPHPSPRNNLWLRKNQWFEVETVPEIQRLIRALLQA